MLCRHCGKKLSLLRRLNDAEFCSDIHRASFLEFERAAALVRLTESGAKYILPEPPAQRNAAQKADKKKAYGKNDIPAPLAGILIEADRKPKSKRKVHSSARMMGWTLIQELPEVRFSIQARHMELASGVPLQTQPAKAAHLVQITAAAISTAVARDEEEMAAPELAPMLGIADPIPARGMTGWAAGEAAWMDEPPPPGLLRLCQIVGTAQPVESPVAQIEVSSPVRADMALANVAAGSGFRSTEWGAGPVSLMMGAMRPDHLQVLMAELEPVARPADVVEPAAVVETKTVFEPAMAGLEQLAMPGPVRAISGLARDAARMIGEPAVCLPCPSASLSVRTMRPAVSLLELDLSARKMAQPQSRSEIPAMRPRRRLVGPRVRPAAGREYTVAEAPLVQLAAGEPARSKSVRMALPGILPLADMRVDPRLPEAVETVRPRALRFIERQCGLALVQSPVRRAAVKSLEIEMVWPLEAALLPAAVIRIEGELEVVQTRQLPAEPQELLMASQPVEEAIAEPAVQETCKPEPEPAPYVTVPGGPPLIDRLIPLFASRGLVCGTIPGWYAPEGTITIWAENLTRIPMIQSPRLVPDHADGSGARESEFMPVRAKRPWLSVQLPSFPIASWRAAPADLKWITLALPVILVLALYSFLPARTKNSVETAQAGKSQPSVISQRFETIRTSIMQRAAVKLADDFRAGLGSWQGGSGWAQSWNYTDSSFVAPGQLALYRPSLGMRDYVFAFLGQIERRSMNWVVRARDERNYVAMRIVMTRGGPIPAASLVRYAVVDGKQDRQTNLPLPVAFRDGTMQMVEVTVSGDTITTRLMGQVVDSFSEPRLARGGVGFYSPKGDRSLLRWVSITHQYDYVGRLCALLAPYNVSQEARRME
jgi:hypothetical protein